MGLCSGHNPSDACPLGTSLTLCSHAFRELETSHSKHQIFSGASKGHLPVSKDSTDFPRIIFQEEILFSPPVLEIMLNSLWNLLAGMCNGLLCRRTF